MNAVLALQDDATASRPVLRSIIASLRGLGLTIIITVETSSDPSTSVSSFGVEEFVADSVLLLHNIGEAALTVRPGRGVVVLPSLVPGPAGAGKTLTATEFLATAADERRRAGRVPTIAGDGMHVGEPYDGAGMVLSPP